MATNKRLIKSNDEGGAVVPNFNIVTYTGDAGNTGNTLSKTVTGVGFQPDFTWIKRRNDTRSHFVTDAVRGAGKQLKTNLTGTETSYSGYLNSFISDGFTLGTDGDSNDTGGTYSSWNWLANNTSGSSNTDGSITSTVSANTTSGFSIVSYTGNSTTGATVGHGLNQTPNMVIIKSRGHSTDWQTWFTGFGTGSGASVKRIYLNQNYALSGLSANSFYPDSDVINMNSGDHYFNSSSYNYIAYCFHSVKGYSKFGSYTGNGSTDGTFVYTGFKPAFVMIKNTTNGNNWFILDNKRTLFNLADDSLFPNSNSAEITNQPTNYGLDILSNGMKMRTSGDHLVNNNNASGNTYIYMAFAEAPLVGSNNVPTTAR